MTEKHAYLIMAHHRPDLLTELLSAIDDSRNDIFLHIDSKSTMRAQSFQTKHASLYIIPAMDVRWAGYSQIECTYRLLEAACQNASYQYYHFLTGATFPLKNQDEMHAFFAEHSGQEFVGFAKGGEQTDYRVKYQHLFSESGKLTGVSGHILLAIRHCWVQIQKILRINRFKKYNLTYKKGFAYWSITDPLARYILGKERIVKQAFQDSISGDEAFIQTLAYNSEFRSHIYSIDDEFVGASRMCPWKKMSEQGNCNLISADLDMLLCSDKCFALKFEGPDGIKLIQQIKEKKHFHEIKSN